MQMRISLGIFFRSVPFSACARMRALLETCVAVNQPPGGLTGLAGDDAGTARQCRFESPPSHKDEPGGRSVRGRRRCSRASLTPR